jgi:hypothetical protein
MNPAFSEYVLYEPIMRILTARGFKVECERECPGVQQPAKGDRKRIDFVVEGHSVHFALEVKWPKSRRLDVARDLEKLEAFHKEYATSHSFLCIFGRKTHIAHINIVSGRVDVSKKFRERGAAIYADLRRTKYGCRIYELDAF